MAAGQSLSGEQKLCALYTLFESDGRRFWKLLQPIFSRAYLTGDAQISGCSQSDQQCLSEQLTALPAAAKLLVVATYIASYNPENTDRIYFEKVHNLLDWTLKYCTCILEDDPNFVAYSVNRKVIVERSATAASWSFGFALLSCIKLSNSGVSELPLLLLHLLGI